MNRDEWGVKRSCLSCSTRFYDFGKSPIICPICNTTFDLDYLSKRKARPFQEKNDVVDNVDEVVDDGLIDDSSDDIDDLDDTSSDIVLDAKN